MSEASEALADVRGWLCENLSASDAGHVCGMLSVVSRRVVQADRLEAENAKLREYAAHLFNFIEPAAHQSECNKSCPAYKMCVGSTRCAFVDWAIEKACELEVEVN